MTDAHVTFCSQCGARIEPGEAFCGSCGAPVEAAVAPPPPAAKPATTPSPQPHATTAPAQAPGEARGSSAGHWLLWAVVWALAWGLGAALALFVAFAQVGGTYALVTLISSSQMLMLLVGAIYGVAGLLAGAVAGASLWAVNGWASPGSGLALAIGAVAWLAGFGAIGAVSLTSLGPLPSGEGQHFAVYVPEGITLAGLALGLVLPVIAALVTKPVAPAGAARWVKLVAAWLIACAVASFGAAFASAALVGTIELVKLAG